MKEVVKVDAELERAYNLINEAVCAEDVFGYLSDPQDRKKTRATVLTEKNSRLAQVTNPDLYKSSPDDMELAREADQKRSRWFELAQQRVELGTYGLTNQTPRLMQQGNLAFETDKRGYYIGEPIAEGTVATVFDGECKFHDDFAGRVAIKIARDPADNDLLLREMKTLSILHGGGGSQRQHLPLVLDHFQTREKQLGLIMRRLCECYDFASVRAIPQYANGVDRKHMVWMLNRLLGALAYTHSLGIVHGNIEPEHLFVRPRDHNLFLIDWCWSVVRPAATGDQFQIATEHFSAPEVARKGSPTPAADLYSAGKCMIYILGGDVETNKMPDSVEDELQRFLRYLVLESPLQRPHRTDEVWGTFNSLITELWGPRKFLAFPV